MKHVVTGAAGFIGSHLVDRLLADGHSVVGIDNFSTGRPDFLNNALKNPEFQLLKEDLFKAAPLAEAMRGAHTVFHLSANADVRHGPEHSHRDLEQNTIVTWKVLEAARLAGVPNFAFSSTGSVYGDSRIHPTPEDAPFPVQNSLYAASKLAGEGLLSAYSAAYGLNAFIFRFVSVLGPRYTHGHIYDFVRALNEDPTRLRVLGNGLQRKSYMHVDDCIDGIFLALKTYGHTSGKSVCEIFNLGTDETTIVNESIECITKILGVAPKREYTGGDRGWVGDVPFILLDCKKIRSLGWAPKYKILESVKLTTEFVLNDLG